MLNMQMPKTVRLDCNYLDRSKRICYLRDQIKSLNSCENTPTILEGVLEENMIFFKEKDKPNINNYEMAPFLKGAVLNCCSAMKNSAYMTT